MEVFRGLTAPDQGLVRHKPPWLLHDRKGRYCSLRTGARCPHRDTEESEWQAAKTRRQGSCPRRIGKMSRWHTQHKSCEEKLTSSDGKGLDECFWGGA
jgi:hypothetical protein